ncbi:serine protease inhibitor [Arthrobacter sp. ERGS1:01]|uniref:serine protease inhibitor n=1 Tax=Arthrobacter sp. ERGS1:01 TaxID=1704044 RepID=UPI000A6AA689|nr:serine protease inhibitor [Arthrobacter sp. ERGS1:01]
MSNPSTGTHPDTRIELAVHLTEAPGDPGHVFLLRASEGVPDPASTVPDPAAALAAVDRFGEAIFFPQPGPPPICTQQYGGPQVALVDGTFLGREVHARFSRTDGCEIARWRALAPLFGAAEGSRGEV